MNEIDLHFRELPRRKRNYAADEPMHPLQIQAYRKMTPAEKLDRLARLHQSATEMYAAGVRMRHPDYTDEQVWREVRERMLRGVVRYP